MNFEKYTDRSKGFIHSAQNYALSNGHPSFEPIHILKTLVDFILIKKIKEKELVCCFFEKKIVSCLLSSFFTFFAL